MFITKRTCRAFAALGILLCLNLGAFSFAQDAQSTKYPDYGYIYVGKDKYENFNRKMFNFNIKLNKYAIRPVHTAWASVMPKYGMDRLQGVTNNIEFPIRAVSSLIQKDFKTAGRESVRFLTNSTLGLGGMYDPAKRYLKIQPAQEDMDQALAKCKCKSGPYLVIPILNSATPRSLVGKILDTGLNPSCYVASPVLALVKAGLTVNRTSYMQPLVKMLESTYADPYEITKKLWGLETYIKRKNLDRAALSEPVEDIAEPQTVNEEENIKNIKNIKNDVIRGLAEEDAVLQSNSADMQLEAYNPQGPVTDSMRTALFEVPDLNTSIWCDLSVWNRSFSKRIKTSAISIYPERDKYRFRYILQKDRTAPVAILYPSIGEGINNHHSVVMAKIFYDQGYSVIIQGSQFQWEFVKSMPKDYRPGMPSEDAEQLRNVTSKILAYLGKRYECNFREKILMGTSFGAMETLFIAHHEAKNNTLNISKYISINPPIELIYAMKQIDKNSEEWSQSPEELKNKVALTAAKVVQITQMQSKPDFKIGQLPFSEEEAKLITGFVLHQKLSDLIFTLENASKSKKSDIYETINNINYQDYAKKYLLVGSDKTLDSIGKEASLDNIADYLKTADNYKIYHALDDYLVTPSQLARLKKLTGRNTILVSNGGHLGFLYRPEFIESFKKDISQKENILVENNS